MKEEEIISALEFLKRLPENRRIFYKFGSLMVEVSKKEAESLLTEALSKLKKEKKKEVM